MQVSDNGNYVAYGIDTKGDERYSMYVRALPSYPANYSGNGLSGRAYGPIANTDGRCTWASDNSTFFVTTRVWRLYWLETSLISLTYSSEACMVGLQYCERVGVPRV